MRSKWLAVLAAAGLALGLVGVGVAGASSKPLSQAPTNGQYYFACANVNGAVRILVGTTCPIGTKEIHLIGRWPVSLVGPQGPAGPQGSPGVNGSNGATGATGATGPAELEAWTTCTPILCVDVNDAASADANYMGGWGTLDAQGAIGSGITSIPVESSASLVVATLYEPQNIKSTDITLTFNPADFSLDTADPSVFSGADYLANQLNQLNTDAVCSATSPNGEVQGNFVTCNFSGGPEFGSGRNSQGDSFDFTALATNPSALVTATVTVCYGHGKTAESSGTFPIAIVPSTETTETTLVS
jgi:hypothetical protein